MTYDGNVCRTLPFRQEIQGYYFKELVSKKPSDKNEQAIIFANLRHIGLDVNYYNLNLAEAFKVFPRSLFRTTLLCVCVDSGLYVDFLARFGFPRGYFSSSLSVAIKCLKIYTLELPSNTAELKFSLSGRVRWCNE